MKPSSCSVGVLYAEDGETFDVKLRSRKTGKEMPLSRRILKVLAEQEDELKRFEANGFAVKGGEGA